MSDPNVNPNLEALAGTLLLGGLEIQPTNVEAANTLFENAAEVYEEAGLPSEASDARDFILPTE